MECRGLAQCYTEIDAYLHGEPTGYPMLINTECLDSHVSVMSRLASNPEIDLRRISDETHDDRLPDVDVLLAQLCTPGKRALIGLSQYLMLRSTHDMENYINKIIHMSIHGRLVVLLYHCDHLLRQWDKKDIRLKNRMFFMSEKSSGLPQISVISTDASAGKQADCCSGIHDLLRGLEYLTSEDLIKQPVICVQTGFHAALFKNSVYSVEDGNDFFARLIKKHPELAGCERSYGTALQWEYLLNELESSGNFTALLAKRICAVSSLQSSIGDVYQDGDKNKLWLLWLGLKLYGAVNNRYLTLAVGCSKQVEDFEECLM